MPSLINFYDSYETQLQTVRENIVSLESLLREMGRNRVHPKVMQDTFAYYRLWKKALQILLETQKAFYSYPHDRFNRITDDLRPIFLRNPPIPPEWRPPPSTLHAGCGGVGPTNPYSGFGNPTGHLTKKPKR